MYVSLRITVGGITDALPGVGRVPQIDLQSA